MKHWRKLVQIFSWIVFAVYLVGLVYFLFFCERMGRIPGEAYRYNMVPFQEIRRSIKHWSTVGSEYAFLNLFGNILCFLPFGAVLPVISAKQRKCWRIMVLSFLSSLLVELIQLVSKVGSCDVDDIFLNTVGGVCGYFVFWCSYRIFCRCRMNRRHKKTQELSAGLKQ